MLQILSLKAIIPIYFNGKSSCQIKLLLGNVINKILELIF